MRTLEIQVLTKHTQRLGPVVINREEGQRRIVVMSNVRSRDLGGFVADVRAKINRDVQLPPGYFIGKRLGNRVAVNGLSEAGR